jgi:dTDP-4-amino-4,6-dideoxygalactose transaminase
LISLAIHDGKPVRIKAWPSWPIWDEQERAAFERVLESGHWSQWESEEVQRFERAFASVHDCEYGICICNGSLAVEVTLRAVGVEPGDEVIVPGYDFLTSAASVAALNAIPVFVDVQPDTYCIDPRQIETAITPKTKAIIAVHIAGCLADMDAILSVAQKHGIAVIEDAAQAHGSEWRGRKVGSFGHLGCFSFSSSKLMTCGEGGIITTNDAKLAQLCSAIVNRGTPWGESERLLMANQCRITAFQAALLSAQLERLDQQTLHRERNALYLSEQLAKIPGIRPMVRDARVTRHGFLFYTFRYDSAAFDGAERSFFIKALSAESIPCSPGHPAVFKPPVLPSHFTRYRLMDCPVSLRASEREAVRLHQALFLGERSDMDDIARAVQKLWEYRKELSILRK